MQNSLQKLAEMGCGNAILESMQERGTIKSTMQNSKMWFKHLKYCLKTGIYTPTDAQDKKMEIVMTLDKIAPLVDKYDLLHKEEYDKLMLSVCNFKPFAA